MSDHYCVATLMQTLDHSRMLFFHKFRTDMYKAFIQIGQESHGKISWSEPR